MSLEGRNKQQRGDECMTIYLDVILLENLCMNYIILCATGLIHRIKIKAWRIFFSSLIGGIYSILSFAPILEVYSNLIFKVLLSIVMVYVAFCPSNIKMLIKQLLIFYLVSFAFGGCAFALLYFIRPQDILMRNGVLTGTYPIKIALLGGIVGFVIVNIAFKVVKGKLSKKDMFCEITVFLKQKSQTMKAFIDTGNLLKDPISGMPVVVIEATQLEELIPKEVICYLNEILEGKNAEILSQVANEHLLKFRIIPFSSLGKQNGLLLAFIADKVQIKTQENLTDLTNIMIGIYEKSLTKSGAYTALVGIDIIERCGNYEYFASIKG